MPALPLAPALHTACSKLPFLSPQECGADPAGRKHFHVADPRTLCALRDLQCSGALIGRSHVVTAAHCVFDINNSLKLVDSVDFLPGLDGTTEPYGAILWETVRLLDVFRNEVGAQLQAPDSGP